MAKSTSRTKVGANIVELRKKFNYSQQAMAEFIGVSRDCFAKYETTVVPPVDKLMAIAKVLNVTTDELLGNANQYQPSRQQPAYNIRFAAVSPYLSNIESSADNIIELDETEAELLLKFRELSEEKQQKLLELINEASAVE